MKPVVVLSILLLAWSNVAGAAVFHVTTGSDASDDVPGDGVCASLVVVGPPVGIPPLPQVDFRCTLRGAIEEANLTPGLDEIVLDARIHYLVGEDDVLVQDDLVIRGQGMDLTEIESSSSLRLVHPDTFELQDLALGADTLDLQIPEALVELEEGTFRADRVRFGKGFLAVGSEAVPANTVPGTAEVVVRDSEFVDVLAGVIAADVTLERVDFTSDVIPPTLIAAGTVGRFEDVVVAVSGFPSACFFCFDHLEMMRSLVSVTNVGIPEGVRMGSGAIVESTLTGFLTGVVTREGDGDVEIENSTLSGNHTGLRVGGWGEILLTHATITDSDLGVEVIGAYEPQLRFDHALVAGNAVDCAPGFAEIDSLFSFDQDGTCGLDLPSANPMLLPLTDLGGPTWTHPVSSGTPAHDAGGTICAASTDQRGEPRPRGAACDVGAFERQAVGAACGLGAELALLLPLLGAWRRRGAARGLR